MGGGDEMPPPPPMGGGEEEMPEEVPSMEGGDVKDVIKKLLHAVQQIAQEAGVEMDVSSDDEATEVQPDQE
jgi:hypothetical protein